MLLIVFALFNDETIRFVASAFVGLGLMLWPEFYFWKRPGLSEAELIEVSPHFTGVNFTYIFSGVLWFLCVSLPLMLFGFWFDQQLIAEQSPRFYPVLVLVFASYAIYQGLFASRKGVYPLGRLLRYIYEDNQRIEHVGKYQIYIATGVTGIFLFAFLLTWWSS